MDEYRIPLKAGARVGERHLEAGMYEAATGERLPALDEEGRRLSQERILLAEVEVR